MEVVIRDVISILKKLDLYSDEVVIYFCLNDDKFYFNLYFFVG